MHVYVSHSYLICTLFRNVETMTEIIEIGKEVINA
jgi:hypothetical protein